MPIRDKSLYPPNWAEISQRIRFERAGGKCEWCGAPNRTLIVRSKLNAAQYRVVGNECDPSDSDFDWCVDTSELENPKTEWPMIEVVLTVAHLDHNPANNDESNLAALCQRCHLNHDAQQHAINAAKTRQSNRDRATGQLRLIE